MDNYINGAVSGIIATAVSQPFFTLKTHMQNSGGIGWHIFKRKWLYAGLTRACVGYGIEKALVFGTYNTLMSNYDLNSATAGCAAGIVASFSITPFEQLTINRINSNTASTVSAVSNKCVTTAIVQLYKGLLPTMAREAVGFAIYFSVYDIYNPKHEIDKSIMGGILAITSAWCIITPIDKIKTNIQSGIKIKFTNLYSGFHFALMRAIPFHVTCFAIFDTLTMLC